MFVCRACANRSAPSAFRPLAIGQDRLAATSRALATSTTLRRESQDGWSILETASKEQHGPRRNREVKEQGYPRKSDWVARKESNRLKESSSRESQRNSRPRGDSQRTTDSSNFERTAYSTSKSNEKLQWATKKELHWTKDPYHIAQNVAKKLQENDFDKALLLTQQASKDKQVVVSWNHLIEYQFKNQKLHAAIKLYNDMKKRFQLPNAQTYTTIFKGCAESEHPKLAVGESLKIYNAMLSSTRLKPNTIHLNAVLDVCARAQDLESMFVALRTATGIRSPNNMTYTIILNALRHQIANKINPDQDPKEQEESTQRNIATTISRAKLVWDEVMTRWKKGEIIMDEELMCSMGRLLLLGGAKETDSVLEVVGEVLGITKLLDGQPGLINPEKQERLRKNGKAERAEASTNLQQLVASAEPRKPEKAEDFSSERPRRSMPEAESEAQVPQVKSTPKAVQGAKTNMAGNNTLSLVMRALAEDKRTKLAARYWDFMTLSLGIVPDRRNYRDYIDCLSTGASSGKATRLLTSMPSSITDGNLYRRGLLLCHFDGLNENAFKHATTIYDVMAKRLRVPDLRCMKLYLEVSMSNYRHFRDRQKFPRQEDGDRAYGRQMFKALDRVWEPLRRATNDLSYSEAATSSASPQEAWKRLHSSREEVMDVAKKFIATSDKLLSQALIAKTEESHKICVIRRRIMDDFVLRWLLKNEQMMKPAASRS
ncbi:hypothetical protein BD289DRAFT_478275 [Coniella lustricola]|uniref:Pentatricopeptide repeat protein n=1 Tax=Coniella lustricola TaxID=2025994 RepID=A0A2T3AN39_9PEZI|nr:hypothetical protein BD289DRAFT_478275 [Coniella lustricola]